MQKTNASPTLLMRRKTRENNPKSNLNRPNSRLRHQNKILRWRCAILQSRRARINNYTPRTLLKQSSQYMKKRILRLNSQEIEASFKDSTTDALISSMPRNQIRLALLCDSYSTGGVGRDADGEKYAKKVKTLRLQNSGSKLQVARRDRQSGPIRSYRQCSYMHWHPIDFRRSPRWS